MEQQKLSFAEARDVASAGLIFTTHTPVPAGHDYFPPALVNRYLGDYIRRLGLTLQDFLGLGRQHADRQDEEFCMTVLALRMASASNGVSKLHGEVSRGMWKGIWPGVPQDEIPIGHVTNGVHFRSWISAEMNQLYDRYLGPKWREEHADPDLWRRVESIPAEELWRTHERRRERLVAFARRRLHLQLLRRGAPQSEIDAADEVLDPDTLTIGFARRFATYKRATLLLRDIPRLQQILNQPGRPVQILFAGKAHPRDDAGKALIQQVVKLAQQKEFRRRIVFLEDYDMAVARSLVQGTDIWLNTPLRPEEASGTSGMKVLPNGGLNLSIPDGWWDEAWQDAGAQKRFIGWAIGNGESYDNRDYQDQVESSDLYALLERDIVPGFYERSADGLPRRWIAQMKSSISTLCPVFNMQRMVRQYAADFYVTADEKYQQLTANQAARARALAAWTSHVQAHWKEVRVESVDSLTQTDLPVGSHLHVRARLQLGALTPDQVAVELYVGRLDADGELIGAHTIPMEPAGPGQGGIWTFEDATVPCPRSGLHGYTVRITPFNPDAPKAFLPGVITWADAGVKTTSG
jgi:starch phosphorylase